MSRALPLLLAVTYLVLAHGAAQFGQPWMATAACLTLVLLLLFPSLLRRHPLAWLALALTLPALFWLHRHSLSVLPLYTPPILLNVFLAWLFGHTLLTGRRPLIERLIRLMNVHPEPLDPAIVAYARGLTAVWTALFVLLATVNLLLALCAVPDGLLHHAGVAPPIEVPRTLWSLFANVLNYILVAALFVGEFFWRQHRFANLPYRNLYAFLRQMANLGPDVWRKLIR